jgi:hypothetical protein
MRRIRQHLSFANVASAIALFVALGGGTAAALSGHDTVQSDDLGPGAQVKAPDVADNAVVSSDIKDGRVTRKDLSAQARTRRIDFHSTGGDVKTTVMTLGDLQLSASCGHHPDPGTSMTVYVKNVGSDVAGVDAAYLLVERVGLDDPVPYTWGMALGPGTEHSIGDDRSSSTITHFSVSGGTLKKGDGQIVMRTPGRVETVTFHAGVGGNPNGFCQLSGTAALADS